MLKKIILGKYILIDADGLNILSKLKKNVLNEKCIITPHLKEASRLLSCSVEVINKNKKISAINLAKKFNCWVVLKSHKTIISSNKGEIFTNSTGNASLSTAGTGDVLAGIIGSLIVQKIPIKEAIIGGVWMHGKAADILVANKVGPIGLTAHELINQLRILRNEITRIKN